MEQGRITPDDVRYRIERTCKKEFRDRGGHGPPRKHSMTFRFDLPTGSRVFQAVAIAKQWHQADLGFLKNVGRDRAAAKEFDDDVVTVKCKYKVMCLGISDRWFQLPTLRFGWVFLNGDIDTVRTYDDER
jgi:hypothetical protein